jgi:hypothetical protein
VLDTSDLIRIDILILLFVLGDCIVGPRALPEPFSLVSTCILKLGLRVYELVQHTQILVGLEVAFVVLYWCVEADGFESCFLPRGDNVPAKSSSGDMIECAEPLGEKEGWLERRRGSNGEGKIFGYSGHGADRLVHVSFIARQ